MNDEGEPLILPCPEPIFFAVYTSGCFISSYNGGLFYSLLYLVVVWQCFVDQPLQNVANATDANRYVHDPLKELLCSFERHILPGVQVSGQRFYLGAILHGGGHMRRKGALHGMSAGAGGFVHTVFCVHGLYNGQVYDLAAFYEFVGQVSKVASAVVAVAGFVGYHLIGGSGALQGAARMPGLTAGLFAAAFSEALVLSPSVRVLRWGGVGVAAVLFVLM